MFNKNKQKVLVFAGGGTAGHVMPNLALADGFRAQGFALHYIGLARDRGLVERQSIPFSNITAGKLRRYFSWENMWDVFRVLIGIGQSCVLLLRLRPQLVFCKGGYASVPVGVAAKLLGIPMVAHESDISPGLANKILARLARVCLVSFPETQKFLPASCKVVVTGNPIRSIVTKGSRARGLELCDWADSPLLTLLVMGGSQGAGKINDALEQVLPKLVQEYRVIHLTGVGKELKFTHENYRAFPFTQEIEHLYALSQLVISRSGANSLSELLSCKLPMLLIPLVQGSRGDQVENAKHYVERGWALTLPERDLTPTALQDSLSKLKANRLAIIEAQTQAQQNEANERILQVCLDM